ncbi:unnamed protein product [Ilex paraguariensis]|uniref:Clathrin light chain n=1 Tax=Ilex paraguariensis TaxID=185542 RepID=A0ABC8SA64_9AQUA
MASFDDTYGMTHDGGDEVEPTSGPFDNDGYSGYDPHLASQRYEFDLPADDSVAVDDAPPPPIYNQNEFSGGDVHSFNNNDMQSAETYGFGSSPPPVSIHDQYTASPFEESPFGHESNGNAKPYDMGADTEGIFTSSDGPVLPDPSEMREEGAAFREWRRDQVESGNLRDMSGCERETSSGDESVLCLSIYSKNKWNFYNAIYVMVDSTLMQNI